MSRTVHPVPWRPNNLDEIFFGVVDRPCCAQFLATLHFLAFRAVVNTVAPNARGILDGGSTDPAGAAVYQDAVVLGQLHAVEQVGPDGEKILWDGGRPYHVVTLGQGQCKLFRRDRVFRVGAECEAQTSSPGV